MSNAALSVSIEASDKLRGAETFLRGTFTSRQDLAASMLDQLTDRPYARKIAGVVSRSGNPHLLTTLWRDAVVER